MKVLLLNGSPRKNWNTHKLLLEAERGAQEAGAETKLVHLYDLSFTDCKSCFACKLKNGKTNGVCALRDDLRPVLEYAREADAIIVGSPIYYSNLTAPALAFMNRLRFALMYYDIDPQSKKMVTVLEKPKKCALVLTMNVTEPLAAKIYRERFESERQMMESVLGSAELFCCYDTYQFTDYAKYHANAFDAEHKAERREKQFPLDLQNVYELGKRMAGAQ